ncbi:MAG: carboxypeptidase-like regulatory domain-containing protein [Ignavibacteriales bacterium]|nr:carboxypeptidase-like regulatory domain-containing protein [Ignavibacteriales bacterium]
MLKLNHKHFSKLILLVIFSSTIFPQNFYNSISGRILDESSGKPLARVNVFITGTTWGAITDEDGYYKISSVKPGKLELVVSMIGFEITTKIFTLTEKSELELNFRLKQKSYELNSIEIISEKPVDWQNNLRTFQNLFLGQNKYSSDCTIVNSVKLEFDSNMNNILSARIDEPLVIINKALGYKIYCVLLNFKWDMDERRIQFLVKPRFEEMNSSSEQEKLLWLNNRKDVFNGSLNHFLRGLINNDFLKLGYKIYFAVMPSESKNLSKLQQIFSRDKLLRKGMLDGEYSLHFENYVRIVFDENISWLKLCYPEVTLDKFGNPEESMPFETYGYWATSGMADMLPNNFEIESEE